MPGAAIGRGGALAVGALLLGTLVFGRGATTCSPIPIEPSCVPDCAGRACGDDGCGGTCGACAAPDACDLASGECVCECPPEADPLCGRDGVSYAGPCELACATGDAACVAADDCPGALYAGVCQPLCHVADATPVAVGAPVPAFLCFDRNRRSATSGAPVSDLTLGGQVWIAYFASCGCGTCGLQAADLAAFVAAHPEWTGRVRALMVNHGAAAGALPACESATTLPIVQDAPAGALWAAIGTFGYALVGPDGALVARYPDATLPSLGPRLEAAIAPLLVAP
jgi:hypothetical protein